MLRNPVRLIPLAAVLLGAGCAGPLNPFERIQYERRPATLAFSGDPIQIEHPARVTIGVPFTVAIASYGGGCMKKGDTRHKVEGLTVEIRPFDYEAARLSSNTACPNILALYRHEARLTLSQTGTARLRVHGWREPEREPLVVERTLVVQPAQP